MGDLINRETLLNDFRNTITDQSDSMDWLDMIYRQPVAYDVDKVMEQFAKEKKFWEERNIVPVINLEKAIKIVKAGGKE